MTHPIDSELGYLEQEDDESQSLVEFIRLWAKCSEQTRNELYQRLQLLKRQDKLTPKRNRLN